MSTMTLSIYGIYIAPLQGNYSEALPAKARAKRKEKNLVNYITRNRCNIANETNWPEMGSLWSFTSFPGPSLLCPFLTFLAVLESGAKNRWSGVSLTSFHEVALYKCSICMNAMHY